jgi:hypothetical protein
LFASLFPRDFGRFLLIGLAGKAALLFVLAIGFLIAAAFAARRQDIVLPLVGMAFAVYELLAQWRVSLLRRTLRPIQPAGMALVVLVLSGVWFLQVAIPFESVPSELKLQAPLAGPAISSDPNP